MIRHSTQIIPARQEDCGPMEVQHQPLQPLRTTQPRCLQSISYPLSTVTRDRTPVRILTESLHVK